MSSPPIFPRPDAAAKLIAEIEARGLTVATLINNAGFGLAGTFARLPLDRQRQMLDLNVATLTELSPPRAAGDARAGRGRDPQCRLDRRVPGRARLRGLFRDQGLCAVVQRGAAPGNEGQGVRVSVLCPGPTRTEFGAVAGVTSARFDRISARSPDVVAAGLRGLDRNQALIIPGLTNKISAQASRLLPRFADAPDRRLAQTLGARIVGGVHHVPALILARRSRSAGVGSMTAKLPGTTAPSGS